MSFFAFKLFLVLLLLNFSAHAKNLDKDELLKIKDYLANINNFQAEFTQINNDESINKGRILIKKPKKFRFEYYDQPIIIASNGKYIIYYDKELEQSNYLNNNYLSEILVGGNIFFNKNTEIISAELIDDNYKIAIKSLSKDVNDKVVFFFSKKDLKLLSFTIIRADLSEISLVLSNLNINQRDLPDNLFEIKDSRFR